MSALAKLLHQLGYTVSGSDLKMGATLPNLADIGMEVWAGSRPDRMAEMDLVVASSAVPPSDPELQAAGTAGVPVWDRPALLAALTRRMPTIGATGTHGKTTTTALLVAGLRSLGRDPSFVVGGELRALATNAHLGEEELLVLEADEAFGTFLRLSLAGLVVTNVEPEHIDHFGSVEAMEDAYLTVATGVDGPVVAGADDEGSARLAARAGCATFGLDPSATWVVSEVEEEADRVRFRLEGAGRSVAVEVGRPGLHMVRNAAGALALLGELGHDLEAAAVGMRTFAGVRRRFEVRGEIGGVTMIDDYAHHPTEVAALLEAAGRGGWRRIWAVFQPHLYSRTVAMSERFGPAFAGADQVVITDIFGAREPPQPGVTDALVAEAVRRSTESEVVYVPHRAELAEYLAPRVEPGDLVLSIGAGDITGLSDELAPRLAARFAT